MPFYSQECIIKGSLMNIKMLKAALASLVLSVSGFANAGLIDQSNINGSGGVCGYNSIQCEWIQEIEVGISGQLLSIDFKINSSATQDGFLNIYDSWSNTASLLGTINYTGLTLDNNNWFNIDVSSLNLSFEIGDFFAVGIANNLGLSGDSSAQYTQGNLALRYINGNFRDYSDWDLHFVTHVEPQSVPEPSTLAIFALGIMGLASRRFKKQ